MVIRLSRSKLAQVCRAFDGGEFDARNVYTTSAPVVFLAKNNGSTSINEGAPLSVAGFSSTLSFAKASERLNNASLVVLVASPAAGENVHAIALERIAPGKIGRASSFGLVFHAVTINASTDGYADVNFSSSSSDAYYQILAKSSVASGSAVCALFHATSGGGGGTPVNVVQSVDISLSSSDTETTGSIPYLYDVDVSNGALVFTTKYLTVSKTTQTVAVVRAS